MGIISKIFSFENIGGKIKSFTKWFCWITILLILIFATLSFLILLATPSTSRFSWIPIIGGIIIPACIWVASWPMYALGQLIDDAHSIRNQSNTIDNINKNTQIKVQPMMDNAESTPECKVEENFKRESDKNTKCGEKSAEIKNKYEDFKCLKCKKWFTVSVDEDTAICPYCSAKYKVY